MRGKHKKRFTTEVVKSAVLRHIGNFSSVESHYCRKNTSRKYLELSLNITKMHELFIEQCAVEKRVKFHVYRNIYNNDFNLAFFEPKKDRCDLCEKYKIATKSGIMTYGHLGNVLSNP